MKQSLLFLIIVATILYADNLDTGRELIKKGQLSKGCSLIEKAYRDNPFLPKAQVAYARIAANGSKAEELYKKVLHNAQAHKAYKAKACYGLAQYYTSAALLDSAMKYISRAEKYAHSVTLANKKAHLALMSGDYSLAQSLWKPKVNKKGIIENPKETYYYSNALFLNKQYESALDHYIKVMDRGDSSFAAPALAGACLTAEYYGNSVYATDLYTQLIQKFPSALELQKLNATMKKDDAVVTSDITTRGEFSFDLEPSSASVEEPKKQPVEPIKKPDKKGVYTLQIGAFLAKDNAEALQKKMAKEFSLVTIAVEKIKRKTFYKVRLGDFSSEEKALAFGKEKLYPRNIKYRVITLDR